MLYDLQWLATGKSFPPITEIPRLERYWQNASLFDGNHFADTGFKIVNDTNCKNTPVNMYLQCAKRIERVIGNFEDIIAFPVLLNYQRLLSIKMADLVCGEYPTISVAGDDERTDVREIRDRTDFDAKIYSTVIDMSRYGDAIWLIYKDYDDEYNFTCWSPDKWFPIVAQDGTNSIIAHCLCWVVNVSEDISKPNYHLKAQVHYTGKGDGNRDKVGYYDMYEFQLNTMANGILELLKKSQIATGLDICAVEHLRAFRTSDSIYGYDDYMQIDSILSEIMTRVGQISVILDKHADPNLTGPVSMLTKDENGEYHLKLGKFFATSEGESQPKYLTWEGQLPAAFDQLEFLVNQLYILSEMGNALLGGGDSFGQAISGTAMRFKMVNPLSKARRVANALTRPSRLLFSALSNSFEYGDISIFWKDGLPDDPREIIENCKLASGETKMMPLSIAIQEYFDRSSKEANAWVDQIRAEELEAQEQQLELEIKQQQAAQANKPGPQNGTGVNPQKKGSTTGSNNFHGSNNKPGGDSK